MEVPHIKQIIGLAHHHTIVAVAFDSVASHLSVLKRLVTAAFSYFTALELLVVDDFIALVLVSGALEWHRLPCFSLEAFGECDHLGCSFAISKDYFALNSLGSFIDAIDSSYRVELRFQQRQRPSVSSCYEVMAGCLQPHRVYLALTLEKLPKCSLAIVEVDFSWRDRSEEPPVITAIVVDPMAQNDY